MTMRRDEWGVIEIDDRGYAHRGPEYASRFSMLERVAGLDSPWRANRDGSYSTTFPIYSKAHKIQTAKTVIKLKGQAVIGGLPDGRPEWLRDFARVTATVTNAPDDLPTKFDDVTAKLTKQGWTTSIRSIGSDTSRTFGMTSTDQPVDLWMHRTDRLYSADEARQAFVKAVTDSGLVVTGANVALSVYRGQPNTSDASSTKKSNSRAMLPWLVMAGVGWLYASR